VRSSRPLFLWISRRGNMREGKTISDTMAWSFWVNRQHYWLGSSNIIFHIFMFNIVRDTALLRFRHQNHENKWKNFILIYRTNSARRVVCCLNARTLKTEKRFHGISEVRSNNSLSCGEGLPKGMSGRRVRCSHPKILCYSHPSWFSSFW